jgi:hypothetical protein
VYLKYKNDRLRVFENSVLRRIFGPKRDEMTGGWSKVYNEELHNLCYLSSMIRMMKSGRMRWAGHVSRRGPKRHACRILRGKPDGKKPLGKPSHGWVDNVEMDLEEILWGGWSGLIWLRIGTSGLLL